MIAGACLPRPTPTSARGFTLIEALVTLALLGLLAGAVFPSMSRWYAALVARQDMAELNTQLTQLPAVATAHGLDLTLEQALGPQSRLSASHRLVLPAGWTLVEGGELRFLRTGLCQAGVALLRTATLQNVQILATAQCELHLLLLPQVAGRQ